MNLAKRAAPKRDNKRLVAYGIAAVLVLVANGAFAGDPFVDYRAATEQQRAKIEAQLDKTRAFRSSLNAPQDAAAIAKAEQAITVLEATRLDLADRLRKIERVRASGGEWGYVRKTTGSVQRKTAGGVWVMLREAELVIPGDAVRTGADGSVDLSYQDGSVVGLQPNSFFTFTPKSEQTLEQDVDAEHRARTGPARVTGTRQ